MVLVDKLWLLEKLFDEILIPNAVWEEITTDERHPFHQQLKRFFSNKVLSIKGQNELTFVMDYGESESIILYREQRADFLLIDDKKARRIAENFGIKCIGTLGLLSISKDKGFIEKLKPIFVEFLNNKRYYSIDLMNKILEFKGEESLDS